MSVSNCSPEKACSSVVGSVFKSYLRVENCKRIVLRAKLSVLPPCHDTFYGRDLSRVLFSDACLTLFVEKIQILWLTWRLQHEKAVIAGRKPLSAARD